MKQTPVKLSPADCDAISQVLKTKAGKLPINERMQLARMARTLREAVEDFKETITPVDLSHYQTAIKAATEKYQKNDKPGAIDQYNKDMEAIERKYKKLLNEGAQNTKKVNADSRRLISVEVNNIKMPLVEKMDLTPGEFEILLPLITE